MSSAIDKILEAMAMAEHAEDANDAGTTLMALIRKSGHAKTGPTSDDSGGGGHALRHALSAGAGGETRIRYDREFLFSCSDSPLCKQMPKYLGPKLDQFPLMKRKVRGCSTSSSNASVSSDHFRLFEHQPSVVDSLPLRPTAQIYTWDPNQGQWVPRSRPQEP